MNVPESTAPPRVPRRPDRRRPRFADPLLIRLPDAAAAVGLSVSGMRDLIERGEIEARRSGRAVLIPTDELKRWAAQLPPAA